MLGTGRAAHTCIERRRHSDGASQDFVGGHVKGAVNIPSESFRSDEQVDAALQSLAAAGKQRIVVHCALSQQRGPAAARRCPPGGGGRAASGIFTLRPGSLTPPPHAH